MSSFTYWPYDEVSLDARKPGELTVRTPWMEATTAIAPFNPVHIARLKSKLHDKSLSVDDLFLVNDFFRHFHNFPLAYILPTPKTNVALDNHTIDNDANLLADFDEILFDILVNKGNFTEHETEQVLTRICRTHFEWDHHAALDFATIDNAIHPESLFSIARRYHILELLANDRGKEIFSEIKRHGAQQFRKGVARLVRQNHYVTEQCQQALKPALLLAGQAAPLIEEFMEAERGHDKILKKALYHLGAHASEIEVTLQTRALMTILSYLAERNFLAFSMAVDAFERNNYEETDPIARMLIDGGFEKAAEFINLHMKINDSGNHDNVAQQFLQYMDLTHRSYGQEALRLMEILSVVMSSISQSAEG